MDRINTSVNDILEKIDKLAHKHIDVVAVTKGRSLHDIQDMLCSKIKMVGNNKVQEAEDTFPYLEDIEKHLIGPLQSNKENAAIELFDVIQTIEDIEQLIRISNKCKEKNIVKRIFIQFNTAGEHTKHGLLNPDLAYPMMEYILENPNNIKLEGIMTVGAFSTDETEIGKSFNKLACIKDKIMVKYPIGELKLSMGMSNDYEIAIKEGSDMLRLGRILFR